MRLLHDFGDLIVFDNEEALPRMIQVWATT
jgi:hypothetical protein